MAATPSGKDKQLRYTRLWVDSADLSGDSRTYNSLDNALEEIPNHGWDADVRHFLRGRRTVGVRGYQAMLNDAAARAFSELKLTAGSEHTGVLSLAFGGGGEPAVPDPAYLLPFVQIMDNGSFDQSLAVLQADFISDAGQIDGVDKPNGVVLQGKATVNSTFNGSSHDNEAATSDGWYAHLHVFSSSSGDFSFVLEHSSDDSAWSTLGTFNADGSAATSELLTGTGTVNQYVRLAVTRTAGSADIAVTFARN